MRHNCLKAATYNRLDPEEEIDGDDYKMLQKNLPFNTEIAEKGNLWMKTDYDSSSPTGSYEVVRYFLP